MKMLFQFDGYTLKHGVLTAKNYKVDLMKVFYDYTLGDGCFDFEALKQDLAVIRDESDDYYEKKACKDFIGQLILTERVPKRLTVLLKEEDRISL